MTPQQRAQYLPVMKALLKVMETGNLTTFSVFPNLNNLAPNSNTELILCNSFRHTNYHRNQHIDDSYQRTHRTDP